jgi:hypothetical protein
MGPEEEEKTLTKYMHTITNLIAESIKKSNVMCNASRYFDFQFSSFSPLQYAELPI